ncbi:hypothetical protein FSP39_007583 [Pinctada imbricata]|uniref:Uncharacterized protein n=1 Tax=Pinctada imbricata TaxID=66713 RepID=A0AA88XDC1_PINIB|nr:hypothetical protein FSP39_007583 [Pinctada imbricata]
MYLFALSIDTGSDVHQIVKNLLYAKRMKAKARIILAEPRSQNSDIFTQSETLASFVIYTLLPPVFICLNANFKEPLILTDQKATHSLPVCHAAYTFTLEQQLRQELFVTNDYNKLARPDPTTRITVQLNLLTLKELNIRDQYLSVIGYFVVKWDETSRLKWNTNPTYNSDIDFIFCTETEIWVPPVIIENSVDNIGIMSDTSIRIRVAKDGEVTWSPTSIFTTNCVTDVTYYPFDTQTCAIVLTSWGYTKQELQFRKDNVVPLGMNNYKENGEWEYVGYSVANSIVNREAVNFFQLTYSLTFKRRPMYHVFNSIIPMVIISILACFVFKLPADAGEKMGYALTILLTSAVYLTLVADNIPTTSINTPYLSVYLVSLLSIDVMSVILTVLILEIYHTDSGKQVPGCLKFIIGKFMGSLVCYGNSKCCCRKERNNKVEEVSDFSTIKSMPDSDKENEDDFPTWQDLARIMDIFFFRLYCICLVSFTCIFLVIMSTSVDLNV